MMEKTVVLVKPDGVQRGLVGEIISRFERKGLKLVGIKMVAFSDEHLKKWYAQYVESEAFPRITKYMKWTPVVAMVWEGYTAISLVRRVIGTRKGYEAESGSIRGDLAMSGGNNLIHASDSAESAQREIGILFGERELFEYKSLAEALVYSEDELQGVFR